MGEVAGSRLKVRYNGQVLKARRVSWQDRVDLGNVTSSESVADADGIVRKDKIPQTGDMTVRIENASYDPTENMFVAPRSIRSGVPAILYVYPDGLDGDRIVVNDFVPTQVGGDIDVNALQPCTIDGESSGLYFLPGIEP